MTLLIIGITTLISILCLGSPRLSDQLKFNAYAIRHEGQGYRFLSYALVHADWIHLLVNMFVLYSFGRITESLFFGIFGTKTFIYYPMLYLGGIAFSTLYDYGKYKNAPYYNAVGASGAVSGVLFSSIILYPEGKIGFLFIPIELPAPLFGLLYLVYSAYMARRSSDNIGHSAHFWGALFGITLTVLLEPHLAVEFVRRVL
ncbi:MAG: rhomboid family intramembrane serine protease [Bacteroidales bacterium]|nr:rhomboid family intramembrane serine protease [Bacteroidales bacterium]